MPADVYLTLPPDTTVDDLATSLGTEPWWNENAGKWVLDCGNDYWLHNEGRGVVRLTSRYGNTEQFAAYKAALLALGCVEVPSARL